ncbi:MAG: hypothetical protein E7483_04010 [Ruminococcaceae bacterium]|nr:hypothetical protein [Oscillospiraceae bacterium]
MSKKTKTKIAAVLTGLVLYIVLKGLPEKGTVAAFVGDAVIIKSDDGKKVTLIENYRYYITPDEQLAVGDTVKVRDGLFSELSIYRLTE